MENKIDPYNEILYLKKLYETPNQSDGNKTWASQQAKSYYTMLNPDESTKIQGMNASTLDNYLKSNVSPRFDANDYTQKYQDQINKIYDTQKETRLNELKAQRDQAVGQINQQKAQVSPQFQQARNQADVVNTQNIQRLREVMAANGLTASGENVTAQVAQNNQRQANINNLNTQEQQQLNEYNQRIADLNNPASEQAAISQLEAERAKALLDYGMQADQTAYNRQRDQAEEQRYWQQYNDEKAWREYTYNNMSAAEKKQFEQNAQQFGEDLAWKKYSTDKESEYNLALAQAQLSAYKSGFNSSSGGGDVASNIIGNTSSGTQSYQANLKQAMSKYGIPESAVPYLNYIIQHESSFNPTAKNPNSSAYGYGQFINSTRKAYEKKYGVSYDDPVNQIYLTYRYTVDRYGGPAQAVATWKKQKSY